MTATHYLNSHAGIITYDGPGGRYTAPVDVVASFTTAGAIARLADVWEGERDASTSATARLVDEARAGDPLAELAARVCAGDVSPGLADSIAAYNAGGAAVEETMRARGADGLSPGYPFPPSELTLAAWAAAR